MPNPYLRHSWGTKPEQKKREKEYNKEYYAENKDKWKEYAERNKMSVLNEDSPIRAATTGAMETSGAKRDKRYQEYLEISKAARELKGKNASAFNEATRAGKMAYDRYIKANDEAFDVAVASTAAQVGQVAAESIIDFVLDLGRPAWERT